MPVALACACGDGGEIRPHCANAVECESIECECVGGLRSCSHSLEIAVTHNANACAEGARSLYERDVHTSSNSYLSLECMRTHVTDDRGMRFSPAAKLAAATAADDDEPRDEIDEADVDRVSASCSADGRNCGCGTSASDVGKGLVR